MNTSPYIIGVIGGSGSGKTTFVKKVVEPFGDSVTTISLDDYYHPREKQVRDENGEHNFDLPEAFDVDHFLADIDALSAGKTIAHEEYTFNNADATPRTLTYSPAPVIILEGLYLLHFPTIQALLDLSFFIYADDTLRTIRRIKRDGVERNYPLEDVLYKCEHHVGPAHEAFIAPYMHAADIIINNTHDIKRHVSVVQAFIREKLEEDKR
ncbi:MAG: uridine kinase [Parcubacteria group bacterium]|nr:uridine kinase [Parcubacteria group bacterium]